MRLSVTRRTAANGSQSLTCTTFWQHNIGLCHLNVLDGFPFSEIVKEPQGEAALRTAMSLAFLMVGYRKVPQFHRLSQT